LPPAVTIDLAPLRRSSPCEVIGDECELPFENPETGEAVALYFTFASRTFYALYYVAGVAPGQRLRRLDDRAVAALRKKLSAEDIAAITRVAVLKAGDE